MESRVETYSRLKNAMGAHPGFRYITRMMLHERSLHIFGGNFADLERALNFIEDPNNIQKVWAEDKCREQTFFHREVVRHFHNFLSAARSLVEHTRIFMDEIHAGQSVHETYNKEVKKRFADDPMARFVQDLRNYFLHKGVPASIMQLSFNVDSGGPPVSRVLLKAPELRKWTRWSLKSREYLDNTQDEFPLREVIDAYQSRIVDFYEWFQREMNEVHKEELSSYEELRREIAEFEQSAP